MNRCRGWWSYFLLTLNLALESNLESAGLSPSVIRGRQWSRRVRRITVVVQILTTDATKTNLIRALLVSKAHISITIIIVSAVTIVCGQATVTFAKVGIKRNLEQIQLDISLNNSFTNLQSPHILHFRLRIPYSDTLYLYWGSTGRYWDRTLQYFGTPCWDNIRCIQCSGSKIRDDCSCILRRLQQDENVLITLVEILNKSHLVLC